MNKFVSALSILLFSLAALTGCGEDGNEETTDGGDLCNAVSCGMNSHCDSGSGKCVCDEGYSLKGPSCLPDSMMADGDEDADESTNAETDGDDDIEQEETLEDLCADVECRDALPCEVEVSCNPDTGQCQAIFEEEGSSCDDGLSCNGIDYCDGNGQCLISEAITCGQNQICTEPEGQCDCLFPMRWAGDKCVPVQCSKDEDCNDDLTCNGIENCGDDNFCATGQPIECGADSHCEEPSGECLCDEGYILQGEQCLELPACPVPQAVTMSVIHHGAQIVFAADDNYEIEIGFNSDMQADQPESWTSAYSYEFDQCCQMRLFAKSTADTCRTEYLFDFVYTVQETYPSAAGSDGTTAISKDDSAIVSWATGFVEPVLWGENLDEAWKTPEKALGQALGGSTDIVSLGRGGHIVLTFDPPITNGEGFDFAVFENGFNDTFLELAFIEVSSDGEHFERFDSAYLGESSIGAFGAHSPTHMNGLAGKYRAGFGTPFDLETLANRQSAIDGLLDLENIGYVRVLDIVGDGSTYDSFGHTIYDPYMTTGSAGFDLDAIGVLNN